MIHSPVTSDDDDDDDDPLGRPTYPLPHLSTPWISGQPIHVLVRTGRLGVSTLMLFPAASLAITLAIPKSSVIWHQSFTVANKASYPAIQITYKDETCNH